MEQGITCQNSNPRLINFDCICCKIKKCKFIETNLPFLKKRYHKNFEVLIRLIVTISNSTLRTGIDEITGFYFFS